MSVKIRLTRHGKKGHAFYHIVVADSRSPRDGRFIESIGTYNPNTNPATIELDFDRALTWLHNGAQPSDTCRSLLSFKGVMMKKHLLEGVKKGAFTEEVAEQKFNNWKESKDLRLSTKRDSMRDAVKKDEKKRLDAEIKVREARAQAIAIKNSKLANEVKTEEAEATEA